jgi:hypothetical protein
MQSVSTAERDRGLLRMRRLRRAAAGLASALVLAFGILAAQATQKHHTAAASTAGTTKTTGTGSASTDDSGSQLTSTAASAPQSTSRSPSVTSGGS